MDSNIDTNATFICPACNAAIEHNCTQAEIINKKALEFACQNCGRVFTQNSSGIVEATKESTRTQKEF